MHTETVNYRDAEANLTGWFTWQNSKTEQQPGILVIHGGAGLDDHARGRAKGFAELGYLAFACDMYGHGIAGDRQRVMALLTEFRADTGKLCARARAGLEMLRAHPLCDGRLAAVGYCFGGMTVLALARSGAELLGAISVHGSLDARPPAARGAVTPKVLVCHGALDPHVPMTQVNEFVDEMNAAGWDWQLNIYGGALHGFTHETASGIPGVAYNAAADQRSAKAIQEFLAELIGKEEK